MTATELTGPVAFEHRGTGQLPEEERRSTPWTFFIVCTGGSFTLGSVVFGWLPIEFGLGFWPAFTSMVAGTLVGLVFIAPLLVIGTRTATNNATSSGAAFGVRGRLIGSGLGLLLMLVSIALAIWSGGQVLDAGAARLWHAPTGNLTLASVYLILAGASIVIAVWGWHLLVRASFILMIFGAVTVLLMVAAFAGHLDTGYAGGHYALGSFSATWFLSVFAVGAGGVMLMCTVTGDWARYVPASRYPPRRFLPVALAAMAVSYIVPLGVGALVATAFTQPGAPFLASLTAQAPPWYAILLIPMALVGGLGWSSGALYSAGLDLSAAIPRLARPAATLAASAAAVGLILAGSIVWNAADSLTAASLILLAVSAPWAAVVGADYLLRHGTYDAAALQVLSLGQRHGAYWYWRGWNPAGVTAWAAGALAGILTVQTTLYTGQFAGIAGGVDLSAIGSFLIAGVLYLTLETAARAPGRAAAAARR